MNAAQLQPSINLLHHSAEMSDVYGEMEGSGNLNFISR